MSEPLAVIIRFTGDPEDLLTRFEQVRGSWIAQQTDDYEPPLFYALSKTDDGIAVLNVWQNASAHRAFAYSVKIAS